MKFRKLGRTNFDVTEIGYGAWGIGGTMWIGASDKEGGQIQERPVTPGDLAATIYRHFGVPLDSIYTDVSGRVLNLLPNGGEPIREL